MMLDLVIAALAVLVGIVGARRGASQQLAGWVALVLAVLAARPGASLFEAPFTRWLHTTPGIAAVAAGFTTFVVVLVAARLVLRALFRGVLTLGNPELQAPDRVLGFVLGAAKVLAIAWVALSALAFVEERVSFRLPVLSADRSLAFAVAKRWNLFGLADFGPAKSLMKLEQALKSPEAMSKLSSDPAMAALFKDPHWKTLTQDPAVKRAVEQHDVASLLRTDAVVKLLKDPGARAKLMAALETLQGSASAAPPGQAAPPAAPAPRPATK
jgi:membrane protein required for colicin V production